ncbi:hypothetical protein Tco_0378683 [Tanacetum coccineum]
MKLNPKKCSFSVEEGPFLGHLITKHGIKANPSKVKAVTDLDQPRTLKDIQSLNRKLAALNRFLSKGAERSLDFFKVLKGCKDKKNIQKACKRKRQPIRVEIPFETTRGKKTKGVAHIQIVMETIHDEASNSYGFLGVVLMLIEPRRKFKSNSDLRKMQGANPHKEAEQGVAIQQETHGLLATWNSYPKTLLMPLGGLQFQQSQSEHSTT